jgi:hypothetical protein
MSAGVAYAANYTPIPLNPSSFNADPVIEASAPPSLNDYVNVTPDAGTNRTGNTFFEMGYNTNVYASPTFSGNPLTGLPPHGSTFIAISNATHSFTMAPNYAANNVIFVGHNLAAWSPVQGPGSFTLTTPAAYSALSILNASGNGADQLQATVMHQDGTSENIQFSSPDWFVAPSATTAWRAGGLLSMGGGVNNLNGNGGTLTMSDITLGNTTSPVTNVLFSWLWGSSNARSPWGNGRTFIFALSGSTDGVNFAPIAVTGYDHDGIIESNAPVTIAGGSAALTGTLTNGGTYCNFTMDGGTKQLNWTWYEKGYFASYPTTGLPLAGSTFASATEPSISYTMPSTYAGNCAVCLASNILSDTITFASPTAAGSLAFLCAGGNGGLNLRVEMQFSGGASETNWLLVPDWFNRTAPWSYVTFGQVRPEARAFQNTIPQLQNNWLPAESSRYGVTLLPPGQIFSRDPRNGGPSFPDLPLVRLFDRLIPVANSGATITSINLVVTNTGTFGNNVSIFAVSGNAGVAPVITTQPFGLVTDSTSGFTNALTGSAVADNIIITKGWQGSNNISLIVSNAATSPGVSFQWKKAPRGGGWRGRFLTDYDMSTFANVTAPNVGGAQSSVMTISNATLADSGDYLAVLSNAYGMQTSFVATVMVLSTNATILSGTAAGDAATKWSADLTSANGQETFTSSIDQKQQKWLSTGLGDTDITGAALPKETVPFLGPIGFIVTPINGSSIVNTIRFYSANDSPGRDPRDYFLEGSNDNGATFTPITGGVLLGTLMLPTARDGGGTGFANGAFTNPCVEVDFANSTSYKTYRLTITNNMEPVATPDMQVGEIQLVGSLVPNPPVWVRQPLPTVTVYVAGSPTWGVEAGGYPAPKFQWYRGAPPSGTAILNATNSIYTLTNAQLSDSGAQFYCTAQNNAGTITSSASTLTVIAPPTQSYPSTILANSPLAYWRLNEGPDDTVGNNGVITHDYMGGHNGYYSNAIIAVAGYNPVSDPDTAGNFGVFNTANSYVENINDLDFSRNAVAPGAAFSVEAWVYGLQQTVDAAIISKGYNGILNVGTGTGTEQFALDVTGTPRHFRFLVRSASGQGYQALSSVVPGNALSGQAAWHHLLGVCDQPNGNIYLYVDGLLAASASIPSNGGILTQPLPITIGSRRSTQAAAYDNQYVGTIDDAAVYGTALSASQALAHYRAAQLPPLFSQEPTNLHTNDNTIATFFSTAYGAGTVTYQWYNSDGVNPTTPIGGQTSQNYSFTATTALNNNSYQVVAANAFGSVTSAVAQLTVESGAPGFAFQDLPSAQAVFLAHVIQLHVAPSGTAPFTYQWQRNGVNLSDDYRTAGSTTDTLTIGYAGFPDSANYQVLVTGTATTPSTMDTLTVTTNVGFFSAGSTPAEWTLNTSGNGPPILRNTNSLELTSNLGSTGRAAFLNTKQNIASFNATFVYQMTTAAGGADGITFCIQNDTRGATAVGGAGGGLGITGVTPSVELELNIYSPNTRGISFDQNGNTGNFMSLLPNVGIGDNNNPVKVNLNYDGTTLAAKFTDMVTLTTVSSNYTVNIPSIVGASTAYVGFTGADGGVASTQLVSWPTVSTTRLGITYQMVGGNLVLTWPASAGAFLQTTPSLGAPIPWAYDNTDTFRVVGTNATVTVPPLTGGHYFRLQIFP